MSASSLQNQIASSPLVYLGDYIVECDERNDKGLYGIDDVRGISIQKKLIDTKADMTGVSLSPYKVLKPREFCYVTVTSRNGGKISLAINDEQKTFIVSSSYITFRSKDNSVLLPEYLFLLLSRPEFDRYSRFNSWGSARETFDWSEMCRTKVPIPSIDTQRELVAVYNGLKSLAEENEALLQPLSDACRAFVVDCKKKYSSVSLGENIQEYDERNTSGKSLPFLGLNKDKCFMPTVADTNGLDNRKYKVIRDGKFAFSGMQTGRDICIRIGLYTDSKPGVISPAYTTFAIKADSKLQPEYVMMYFKRLEMDRYGAFLSDSSVRSNLDWERFIEIQIPLPPKEVQQSVVNLYCCYEEAKQIANQAREQLRNICSALIQKAAHSV